MLNFLRRGNAGTSPAVAKPVQAEPPVTEERARIGETVQSSDPNAALFLFGAGSEITGEVVTIDSAMAVPAIWAAVTFLSDTLASVPIKVYEKTDSGRVPLSDHPATIAFNHAANDELDAFAWRRSFWQGVLTAGRGLSYLQSKPIGDLDQIWPLDPMQTRVSRRNRRTSYHHSEMGQAQTYRAGEVLDLAFMPGLDNLSARSPILTHSPTIALAQAVTKYGSRFFANGGIPPFVVKGPMKTAASAERAANDVARATRDAANGMSNAVGVPDGHDLVPLGIDPEKMQMIDVKRFLIEEFARIYSLPPAFLQDLTHGTFSNTEQQGMHLVQFGLARWANGLEKQANLKLFGRGNTKFYLEHNLEGLQRGDLKSRAEAIGHKINTGQWAPNEGRAVDNLEPKDGGDSLLVQGAMVRVEDMGPAEPNKGSEND